MNDYSGFNYTKGTISKQESTMLIAPLAKCEIEDKKIKLDTENFYLEDTCENLIHETKTSIVKLKEQVYTITTTPLHFRNYLTISVGSAANRGFTIDNYFYVCSVKELKRNKDFKYTVYDYEYREDRVIYPFESANCFYLLPE
jgi:hypothetical protein